MADATLYDLARLAAAVYGDVPPPEGWTQVEVVTGSYGFQGAAYSRGSNELVLSYRGTTASAGDVAADLKLGVGMNTSHFSQAEEFFGKYKGKKAITLTGHSLGGAIAQIVGNRGQMPFATFNAPGVAVFASRNILNQSPQMMAVRTAGALVGSIFHPMQTARDIRATFNVCRGVNLCLNADMVSQMGVHYGKVVRVPGTGYSPLSQHSISTVVEVLAGSPEGKLTIGSYF